MTTTMKARTMTSAMVTVVMAVFLPKRQQSAERGSRRNGGGDGYGNGNSNSNGNCRAATVTARTMTTTRTTVMAKTMNTQQSTERGS